MGTQSLPRLAGALILLMWAASLVLPVFTACRSGYDDTGGWMMLLIGWMGVMVLQPAWFANILIVLVAALLLARHHAPIWLGVATAAIAACALYFTDMYDDTGTVKICHYYSGYWLWLASAGVALLATFIPRPPQSTPAG